MARRMGALHIRKVYDTGANRFMSSGESAVKCTLEGNLRVCLPIHISSLKKINQVQTGVQIIFKQKNSCIKPDQE